VIAASASSSCCSVSTPATNWPPSYQPQMFRAAVIVIRCETPLDEDFDMLIPAFTVVLARPALGPGVHVSGAPAARAAPADASQAMAMIAMTREAVIGARRRSLLRVIWGS